MVLVIVIHGSMKRHFSVDSSSLFIKSLTVVMKRTLCIMKTFSSVVRSTSMVLFMFSNRCFTANDATYTYIPLVIDGSPNLVPTSPPATSKCAPAYMSPVNTVAGTHSKSVAVSRPSKVAKRPATSKPVKASTFSKSGMATAAASNRQKTTAKIQEVAFPKLKYGRTKVKFWTLIAFPSPTQVDLMDLECSAPSQMHQVALLRHISFYLILCSVH